MTSESIIKGEENNQMGENRPPSETVVLASLPGMNRKFVLQHCQNLNQNRATTVKVGNIIFIRLPPFLGSHGVVWPLSAACERLAALVSRAQILREPKLCSRCCDTNHHVKKPIILKA